MITLAHTAALGGPAATSSGLVLLVGALAWRREMRLRSRLGGLLADDGGRRTTAQLVDALESKLASIQHRTANTHPVTQLPTREQLLASMAADLGRGGEHLLGLLQFGEFDQLLALDDAVARQALAQLGSRIAGAAQDGRLVSQVDRATFAIWLGSPATCEEFDAIAYVAGQQIPLGEIVLTPTLKSSVVRFPKDGVEPEQLLARATAALSTSDPARASEPYSLEASRERFSLSQDLARAIEQEQLTMVFQPVVDLAAMRVIGAEALLRWDHPKLGPVSPARFIPLVEQLGLSERYGLWVLNTACREAARWAADGLGHLKMAINLSAQQVLDPELEAKIERTLARHGLAPSAIELELTETAAMADAGRTLKLFTRLRARGIGLAIDDFGTGYSSLSYLKNLPFTKLKIDREFVTDVDTRPGSRAICKALVELGRGLDLTVLAEGVETAEEVQTLRELGCSVFQGYHFSRPLLGADFLRFAQNPLRGVEPAASLSLAS